MKPPTLDLYMPATPPLALLAKADFWLKIMWRRHHFRRLFVPLLEEEDLILSDIGLNRTDIEWALELPLRVDALKALEACRKARGIHDKAAAEGSQYGTGEKRCGQSGPPRRIHAEH
ncbi:hypothetical protein [Marinobacter sp.]|uniref:hypothetical protein n=1 Tax=Marinobacter sp. TaxID=50741 RepID=UPI00356A564C